MWSFTAAVVALWSFAAASGSWDVCANHVGLLQLDLSLTPADTSLAAATPTLRAAEPLKFLHIPKCGTSFLNAIVHTPSLCPDLDWRYEVNSDVLSKSFEKDFWHECPQVCNQSRFECNSASQTHEGIGSSYSSYKGHLITMMRQPEQRVLSAYHDARFDHGASRYPNVSAYAEGVAGLVTCQLTGAKSVDPVPQCGELQKADALAAAKRLREGFVFVGIMEEWDMSMCLFHKIFGGHCWHSDFENSRPTDPEDTSPYNVSELEGFRDELDGLVYEEAKRIFREQLVAYNVSTDSCAGCWSFRRASGVVETNLHGAARPMAMARMAMAWSMALILGILGS